MTLLAGLALAHPFGAHQAIHRVSIDLSATDLVVRHVVDVPEAYLRRDRPDPIGSMKRELAGGLQVRIDGQTRALVPVLAEHGPPGHTVRFTLQGSLALEDRAQVVEVVDGNLAHTPPVIQVDVALDPRWTVTGSSLWVLHEGRVVRSESGRLLRGDAHRAVRLALRPRDGLLERAHRLARGDASPARSDFAAREPTWPEVLLTNRSTVPTALCALAVLALVPAGLRAPSRPVWAVLAGLVAADLVLPPLAGGLPWALLAAALTGLSGRFPAALWLVGPALAASLDLRGAALAVAALQGLALLLPGAHARPGPRVQALRVGSAALLCAGQALRCGPP